MLVTTVLLVALVGFRAAGALGVRGLAGWRASAAPALAVMLLLTASAHFVPPSQAPMPDRAELAAMVPPQLPYPELLVAATGVLELAGALGLLIPRTRRPAAACLALLFVAMFPANVYAALHGVPLGGGAPTPLWLRAPEQLLYVGLAAWIAWPDRRRERTPEPVGA